VGAAEIFIILVIYLMFFGAKSIPSTARTLGRAYRQFKDATQDIQREIMDNTQDVQKEINAAKKKIKDQVDLPE
jgi:sec-independent protein translocase protein TatA